MNRSHVNQLFVLGVALGLATSFSHGAPVSTVFTYQGRLLDGGVPANGSHNMEFALFADSEGDLNPVGTPVLLADQEVSDGLFTVELDFGVGVFDGSERWLQITVDGTTLSPRQPLTAVPYASMALNVVNSIWALAGADAYFSSGSVGIGTDSPQASLHVSGGGSLRVDVGSLTQGATSALTLVGARNSGNNQYAAINFKNFDNDVTLPAEYSGAFIRSNNAEAQDSGDLSFWTKSSANGGPLRRMTIATTGGLGIGTASPKQMLHNAGDYYGKGHIWLHAFSGDGDSGTAYLQARDDSGTSSIDLALRTQDAGAITDAMTITSSGSVGIGTGTPNQKLAVYDGNIVIQNDDNADSLGLAFLNSGGSYTWRIYRADAGSNDADLRFAGGKNSDLTTLTDYMTLSKSGYVGIGTTAPNAPMNVVIPSSGATGGSAIRAQHNATTGINYAVRATTMSSTGYAVRGEAESGSGTTFGVYGSAPSASGYGVYALGRFGASGTKSFVIDHPTDPANRYLLHYSAEGPEPQNVYNGVAVMDTRGQAVVTLPDYFESINRDYRYQLTTIGGPALVYIAEEIAGNQFTIAGGKPGMKVSWEVTARRNDAFVRTYGAPIEVEKIGHEQGRYLHPEFFGEPADRGIHQVAQEVEPTGTEAFEELAATDGPNE